MDTESRQWAWNLYHSPEFQEVEGRYIEIHRELLCLPPGPKRSRLVDEAMELER